ncbi:endonuclease/exonuclease/phosphatase family protein [Arthrobacter woluwensis]|uniref:endonuclease/exonuclease/phosphatase family protein n=1 Tax=Arthrobacter woluwensis TaxID=156980 RepID=UPI0016436C81|nr:endonuclease/exonuclease/phosphatase family protein [Arthrobacter woluwensis]
MNPPNPSVTFAPEDRPRSSRLRLRDRVALGCAAAVTAAAFLHLMLPGPAGTFFAIILPWLWIPALLCVACLPWVQRRARAVLLVPLLAWGLMAAPALIPLQKQAAPQAQAQSGAESGTGSGRITVASQNVKAGSGADSTARAAGALAERGADVVVLVELDDAGRSAAREMLAERYPHAYTVGTVGIWSRYPLNNTRALGLGLGWKRALAADVETPAGTLTLYAVHAASVRPGEQDARDEMLRDLSQVITADDAPRAVAVGDFNAVAQDPALAGIRSTLAEPSQSTPSFGFSWPSGLPLARIDHVFQRGLLPQENTMLRAGDSDHLALVASFAFPP